MSVRVRRFSLAWLSAFAAAGVLAASLPAAACLNGITRAEPRGRRPLLVALRADELPVPRLVRAEEALRRDDYYRAAAELDAIRLVVEQRSPRLQSRFQRISALVSIRSEGQWPSWVAKAGPNNQAERELVLKEALATLRKRAAEVPGDPIRQTDLGVGLFGFPHLHGEARAILEKLAAKDLLTSPRGYFALSRLRAAAGDPAGAGDALARCRKLDPEGRLCGKSEAGKV
jgi:hypothetical protein